jgi:hypothetical protein
MNFSKIIKEGRKEDFITKYSNKFSPEQIKRITSLIQPKFLDWVGKNVDVINFDDNFSKLYKAIDFFEKNSSNLTITDLYQYKSLSQLISEISEFQKRQRRTVRKVKGGNVVYEDDRFFIVNPLTQDASCYYGKGTKWCTASETSHQFNTYNDDGKLFYIIDKTLPTSDPDYKVAILRKFAGESSYWNATDQSIKTGWIFGTEELNEINSAIDQYLEEQFGEQLKIFRDAEAAKKEKERLWIVRQQREKEQKLAAAEERRLDNEWELGPDCPEEGLMAHALFNYLVDNNDVEPKTNEDRLRIDEIKNQIEDLNTQYDQSEDVETDILDQISELEEELEYLESKVDVYSVIPSATHYRMNTFEVMAPGLESHEYAVGDARQMQDSAEEYVEGLIDDIGYMGFSRGFANSYIDEDAVIEFAEGFYGDDVYSNPEVYIDEDERLLSKDQEEEISILKNKISQTEQLMSSLEERIDGENDDEIQEKIDELSDRIDEMNDEISEIESSPDGDFPDDLIQEKVDELVDDVRGNIEWFMQEFGLNTEDYIDKDAFIEGVIDADGYGIVNGYDGNVDELYVQDILFYVMRID